MTTVGLGFMILKSCEQSLKRLKTGYIDLYMVHWPNPGIPVVETMQAMRTLKRRGHIRNIGVSNLRV